MPETKKNIWDHFEEYDKRRAARSRSREVWDSAVGKLYRLWNYHLHPRAIAMSIRFFFQRRIRGFDDSELWSLDQTILEFILPRLKRFRALRKVGWPGPCAIYDLSYEEYEKLTGPAQLALDEKSHHEWNKMLDRMIRGIELQVESAGLFLVPNPNWKEGDPRREKMIESPELKAEYQEGWDLFVKWFHALWD